MIDKRKEIGIEVDYLQVSELLVESKEGVFAQKVIHRQECPPANDIYYLPLIEVPIKMTIWAMDSEEYSIDATTRGILEDLRAR